MFVDVVVILVLVIPASPWRVNLEDLSLLPSRAGPWVSLPLAGSWPLNGCSRCLSVRRGGTRKGELARTFEIRPRPLEPTSCNCLFVLRCLMPFNMTYVIAPQSDQGRTQTGSVAKSTHGLFGSASQMFAHMKSHREH